MLKAVADKAGITKRVNPHAFRHAMATNQIRMGANLIALKDTLGHANLKMIDSTYSHLIASGPSRRHDASPGRRRRQVAVYVKVRGRLPGGTVEIAVSWRNGRWRVSPGIFSQHIRRLIAQAGPEVCIAHPGLYVPSDSARGAAFLAADVFSPGDHSQCRHSYTSGWRSDSGLEAHWWARHPEAVYCKAGRILSYQTDVDLGQDYVDPGWGYVRAGSACAIAMR